MILPLLAALLTAAGPLLRGAWDLWAQTLLELALVSGFSCWFISRILVGFVPLPSRRMLLWTGALVLLGFVSVFLSPVRGLVQGDWHVFLCALWIFQAMTTLSKDQRSWIDEAIRASGWILVALAFYQHFSLREQRPASALINQNVYAGAVLLLLALAVEKKDWLLTIGLLWSLAWTRSVGAWLGLSAALFLTQRRFSAFWFWTGAGISAICAVAIYAKLGTPEGLHRWWWWKAAARMAWDRPWFGYGPGAFSYVLPRYMDRAQTGLFSLYAHEYPLQIFAEYGFPFGLLWFAGLWRCLSRGVSHKSFGAMAVLIQSLWDYPLAIPSNLWLMSYFVASSIPDTPEGFDIPSRHKLPALVFAAGLGLACSARLTDLWDGQKLTARALEAAQSRHWEEERHWLELAKAKTPESPEVFLESARLDAMLGDWLQAAADAEKAARLNPYRPATWTQWQLAYRKLGRPQEARRILEESLRFTAP